MNYEVHSIKRREGVVYVDYSIVKLNGLEENRCVGRYEAPHPDFEAAFAKMEAIAKRIIEMPLVVEETGELLKLYVRGIKFLEHKDKGYGCRISVELFGFQNHEDALKMVLPAFWAMSPTNQLSQAELMQIEDLKEEAFKYAHENKRQQVTLEEAAREYEESRNGNK